MIQRCQADPSIERVEAGDFRFPLGVYPIEPMTPRQGYTLEFEAADGDEQGDDDGDLEAWPDRYAFDVVISADRLPALCRQLIALFPPRIFPILDFIGHDAFREIDPYISYELAGLDDFMDMARVFAPFFYEDGMCGFGALSDEPFMYFFVDEHKILTIRVEPGLRDTVERLLDAMGLAPLPDPAGADAAAHEHRGVLLTPDDRPDLLSGEEIVEFLRDRWRLSLNVDPDSNLDDDGNDLGLTAWRCLVRLPADDGPETPRYGEILLVAGCLSEAEELAHDGAITHLLESPDAEDQAIDLAVVTADRLSVAVLDELLRLADAPGLPATASDVLAKGPGVAAARWITG